eukprot:301292-Pleurochrysis_carterae.AAC.1
MSKRSKAKKSQALRMTQSWLSAPMSRKWMTSLSWCGCSRWPPGSRGRPIGRGAEAIASSMSPRGTTTRKAKSLLWVSRRRRRSVI